MEQVNSEFWTGWSSALDGVEAAVKTLFLINDYDGRTKPTDVILDVKELLKVLREHEPKTVLTEIGS